MEQKEILTHLWLSVGVLYVPEIDKRIAIERCMRGTKVLGIAWVRLTSKNRRGEIADARHMCSKYLRDCGFSYKEISKILGRGDHSTSVYSVRRGNELLEVDRRFRTNYQRFLNA